MPIINLSGGVTTFLGYYTDLTALQTAHPTAEPGDWAIVDGDPAAVYVWDPTPGPGAWSNAGAAGSIVSVFGRTTPNIVAEAGDYSADLVSDPNTYTNISPTTAFVHDALIALDATSHTHANKANLDTINQNMATTDDVTFASLNLTQALGTPVSELESDYITLTESTSGRTVTLGHISDTSSPSTGYPVMRVSGDEFNIYTNDTDATLQMTGLNVAVGGNLSMGLENANDATTTFTIWANDGVGTPSSVQHTLSRVNDLYRVIGGAYSELHSAPQFVITDAINLTGIPSGYKFYVDADSAGQVVGFSSDAAAGILLNGLVDNSSEVINIGSRLAAWGSGTKYEAIVLGQDDLHLMGINEVHIQENTLVVQLTENRVGINTATPETDLEVVGNALINTGDLEVRAATPQIMWNETDAPVDNRKWITQVAGQTMTTGLLNDAEVALAALLELTTTTYTISPNLTLQGTLQFGAGQAVDTIETAITDDDTHIPTSGAVVDYLSTTGYVLKTGTPVDNQVAVFTNANTIEGSANFTWNGTVLDVNGTVQADTITEHTASAGVTVTSAFVVAIGGNTIINVQEAATKESITINNGAVTINDGFADLNFAIRKNTAGSAYIYDSGLDTHTFSGAMTIGTTVTLAAGATVDNIETAITDDDTHLPTSGAVVDYVASELSSYTTTYTALTDTPGSITANAIVYGNAGGTALTASSNLVFDGSTLTLTGAADVTGDISVAGYVDGVDLQVQINQVAHGFAVGDVIYSTNGTWAKALADDPDTLGVAVVSSVTDVDNFGYVTFGTIVVTAHGFTPGTYLYLDAVTAGALTETEPLGLTYYSNPIAHVNDSNTITVMPYRPASSIPRNNDIRHVTVTGVSTYNVDDLDESLLVDTNGGDVTINLPQGADYDGFSINVKKITNDANKITVKSASGNVEFVIGTTGHDITVFGHAYKYSSNGTDYFIMP